MIEMFTKNYLWSKIINDLGNTNYEFFPSENWQYSEKKKCYGWARKRIKKYICIFKKYGRTEPDISTQRGLLSKASDNYLGGRENLSDVQRGLILQSTSVQQRDRESDQISKPGDDLNGSDRGL